MATANPVSDIELAEWRDDILRGTVTNREQEAYFRSLDSPRLQETRINISDDETSPLIESDIQAGSTSVGSTSSTLSTLGSSAAATGVVAEGASGTALLAPAIVIGAVGVAVGVKGVIDSGQLHLPGHKYFGPGTNSETTDKPVDSDDNIAKIHDEVYSKATSQSEVVEADNTAVHSFHSDFIATGNVHSLIGEVGIQAKQTVEHIAGHIYPQLTKTVKISTEPTTSNYLTWLHLEENGFYHRQIRKKKKKTAIND